MQIRMIVFIMNITKYILLFINAYPTLLTTTNFLWTKIKGKGSLEFWAFKCECSVHFHVWFLKPGQSFLKSGGQLWYRHVDRVVELRFACKNLPIALFLFSCLQIGRKKFHKSTSYTYSSLVCTGKHTAVFWFHRKPKKQKIISSYAYILFFSKIADRPQENTSLSSNDFWVVW